MFKIGIIGERDSVMGFMAIGFAVHEASDPETAAKILHKLAKDESYAIIFMVENFARGHLHPRPPGLRRIGYGRHQVRRGAGRGSGCIV